MSYYPEFDDDDDLFVDEDFDSIDDLEFPVPVRMMSDESAGYAT